MRVFLDTNVVIATFITHGTCHDLMEYCLTEHQILLSNHILEEITENLEKKFKYPKTEVNTLIEFLRETVTIIPKSTTMPALCRDKNDNQVLADAEKGNSVCLITGDKDLLVLIKYNGLSIIKPSEFWKFEKEYTE